MQNVQLRHFRCAVDNQHLSLRPICVYFLTGRVRGVWCSPFLATLRCLLGSGLLRISIMHCVTTFQYSVTVVRQSSMFTLPLSVAPYTVVCTWLDVFLVQPTMYVRPNAELGSLRVRVCRDAAIKCSTLSSAQQNGSQHPCLGHYNYPLT